MANYGRVLSLYRARRALLDRCPRTDRVVVRMRRIRTHAAAAHDFLSWDVALCDGSSFHMLSSDPFAVDCRICMYRLGLYMPLAKLKEHQQQMKVVASRDRTGSFCT